MLKRKPLAVAVATALGVSSFGGVLGSTALAQEVEAYTDDQPIEEIVTTGSRIVTEDGFGRTSPVTVLGMDNIAKLGLTRVEDLLNSLPSVETALHSYDANGISGTASIDLRGLGSNRTLVLFNGRRMQPGGVAAQAPDVNQIPAAMVERVEVLTGGASATYGADAVAGVVNFIMRRVDGVEISVGVSGYQHDNDNAYITPLMDARDFVYPTGSSGIDGRAYNIDFVIGGDFADGRGNATAYATFRDNEELLQGTRDYGSCALSSTSTSCGGSGNAIIPNFYIGPMVEGVMDWGQVEYLTLASDSSLIASVGNVYNYAPVNHFMRPDRRWSIGAFADFEISERATGYLETGFTHDATTGQIAESGTFFNDEYHLSLGNTVWPDAFEDSLIAMWPDENDFGIYIGKRNVEGGPRQSNYSHDGFRAVAGFKGALTDDWDYDISYMYGHTSSSQVSVNDFFGPRIVTAIDGDLCAADADCIPYEVFTYQGVTPEMAAGLTGVAIMQGETSTEVFNGFVSGELNWSFPGADESVMVVAGFEKRTETYGRYSDTIFEEGSLLGLGGPRPTYSGEYDVTEIFTEANVPLLTGDQALTLDLAYRYSDYSTSGGADTYRIGLDYQPVDIVRLRAGYNRAVRAPNVWELFIDQSLGLWSGDDPCSGAAPAYTAAQCANMGVTAAQYGFIAESPADQYNAIFGGNPQLDPEIADTITAGIVIDPMDSMTISLDYWSIELDETISNIGATTILEQCGLYGQLCELVNRNPIGSLWLGTEGYVIDTTNNLGTQVWEGVDVAASWGMEGYGGTWTTNLIGTYMLTKETMPLPADSTSMYDCTGLISTRCFPTPDWRHTASVEYDSNEWWATTLRWRYFGGVDYDGTSDQIAQAEMSSAQNYFDLNATFRFLENSDVIIGVNNILDEEPPMVGGSLTTNANTIAGFYDTLGRFLFAKATVRF